MLTIGQQLLLYSGFKALDIQNTLNDRSALFVFLHPKKMMTHRFWTFTMVLPPLSLISREDVC